MMVVVSSASMASAGLRELGRALTRDLALQQARQTAERAETEALRLRRQAEALQEEAVRTEQEARRLFRQSYREEYAAETARRGMALASAGTRTGMEMLRRSEQALQRGQSGGEMTAAPAAPVRNAEGQLTGRLINVSA